MFNHGRIRFKQLRTLRRPDRPNEPQTDQKEPQSDQKSELTTQKTTQKEPQSDQKSELTTQKTTQKEPQSDQKGEFTTQKEYTESLSTQEKILLELKRNPNLSRKQLAQRISSISEDGIKYHLSKLQEKGIIRRVGPDKGGHWEILK